MERPFLVVIGVGWGGIETTIELLNIISDIPRCSILIAQQTSRTTPSILAGLLSIRSPHKVQTMCDDLKPKNGNIYLCPPNVDAEIRNDRVYLSQLKHSTGKYAPCLDKFFFSIAKNHRPSTTMGIMLETNNDLPMKGFHLLADIGVRTLVQQQSPEEPHYTPLPEEHKAMDHPSFERKPLQAIAEEIKRLNDFRTSASATNGRAKSHA